MTKAFDTCREIFAKNRTFFITTHVNPDPDAIGSELALARFLKDRSKVVSILNHSSTPTNCLFLDPERMITQFDPAQHTAVLSDAEVIVVVDANQPERLHSLSPFILKSNATKICIDHHLERKAFADLYVIDEDAAATGEILFDLFAHLDRNSVTQDIATALYAAIMTDTGSFRFPKTDASLHRMVAHLIERGADPVKIYHEVYEQGTVHRLLLLGNALSTLRLFHNGKVASMFVTRAMFSSTETTEEDTENFVTYALNIAGVQIGLMFTELPGGVKISFRSRGDIPVNKLAQEFGGNGHKNAAGARTEGKQLDAVINEVIARSNTYLT